VGSCGWTLTGRLADAAPELSDAIFAECLRTIEAKVKASPNRIRHSMMMALIGIGVRSPSLHTLAVEAARRLGQVEVDHGETNCKTPEPIGYMERMLAHRAGKKKEAKKATAKKKKTAKKKTGKNATKKTAKKKKTRARAAARS
jgi:hypothetical protein